MLSAGVWSMMRNAVPVSVEAMVEELAVASVQALVVVSVQALVVVSVQALVVVWSPSLG